MKNLVRVMCCLLAHFVIAEGRNNESDIKKSMEKYLQRHLNIIVSQPTLAHVMDSFRGRLYEESADSARHASNIYRGQFSWNNTNRSSADFLESDCYRQVLKIRNDLSLRLPYASMVDDSNGKEESGLFRGNYRWMGSYYECMGQTDKQNITAKMCLVTFGRDPVTPTGIQVGQCIPDVCAEEDIAQLNQILLPSGQFADANCPVDLPFTAIDIVLVTILSVVATIILISTIVELAVADSTKATRWFKLLLCFSFIKNNQKLFQTKRKDTDIAVLDGIRFISMTWVVLGHTYSVSINNADNAVDYASSYTSTFGQLAIINTTLSVDSFFFLSGLLVTYVALRRMQLNDGKLNVPLMYLQRYIRLTPIMILTILFMIGPFQKIGGGLRYQSFNAPFGTFCEDYWWTSILYINNFWPANFSNSCVSWTWYLANDMQFFIVAPIFILLLYRYPKAGLIALGIGVLASASVTGALARYYQLIPDVYIFSVLFRAIVILTYPLTLFPSIDIPEIYKEDSGSEVTDVYWDDIYAKPWCRIGVYCIGMLTAYILHTTKGKVTLHKAAIALLWMLVVAVELALVYGWSGSIDESQYSDYPNQNLMAFYEAVRRPLWGFGLMWVTVACTSGYGGPVHYILSWKGFLPLSRLTYSVYMVHIFVIHYMFTSREDEAHVRIDALIYYFLAALVLALAFAYLLYLLVEAPVAEMQRLLLSRYHEAPSSNVVAADMSCVTIPQHCPTSNPTTSSCEPRDGHENPVDLNDEKSANQNKL